MTIEKTSEKKTSSKWVTIAIEAAIVVVAVLIGLGIRWGIYETAIVTSGSMENTLQVGDRMLIDHRASLHGSWRRGDIVLFHDPESWQKSALRNAPGNAQPPAENDQLVKRVIGLPGETVTIKSNLVYVNDQLLNEPYLKEPMDTEDVQITLGTDQYFMMGDNRNNSDDSRFNSPIDDGDIIGRVIRLIAPFSRMGGFPANEYSNADAAK